jgi:hypothetical protein
MQYGSRAANSTMRYDSPQGEAQEEMRPRLLLRLPNESEPAGIGTPGTGGGKCRRRFLFGEARDSLSRRPQKGEYPQQRRPPFLFASSSSGNLTGDYIHNRRHILSRRISERNIASPNRVERTASMRFGDSVSKRHPATRLPWTRAFPPRMLKIFSLARCTSWTILDPCG